MTAFDFDSAEHKAYEKTPAAKSIPSPAGIWIAYENQQLAAYPSAVWSYCASG
ncbi:hypothetical protein [Nostoc sp. 'Peltigera malacea cyanobiont' DB3992]|uniref:hypothetical protein n=1 Tax=Nostoc sp. 'Peltigera malacea cyanobiont' DB3992 TaxID=1206980 RepID=UPI0015D4F6C8|nr:hypothetical protein [Nostoc sp. 'Peltigera malacea cyanobiont' DB3992]